MQVSKDNIDLYVQLYLEKYSQQDKLQFEVFMEGINYVCGSSLLAFITPEIAARRASSQTQVSWKAIKLVTKFDVS